MKSKREKSVKWNPQECSSLKVFFIFSRPLQCNVRLMSWDVVCLSVVCNRRVLWPNGLTDQDETWHAGRPWPKWHCVRWGPSSPSLKGHSSPPPIFGPCLLWPNGCMDHDATWYADRPGPKWHCIRWGTQLHPPKGHSSPTQFFSAHVYCGQTAAWIRMPCGMQIGLYALLGEAIFSACHTNPNPTHWSLVFVMGANRRA